MATKSFLKNIDLRGERQCKDFIRALEKSRETAAKEVTFSRPVSDMSREEAKNLFKTEKREA